MHRHQKKKRYETYRTRREDLSETQQQGRVDLLRVHAIQGLSMRRRLNNFEKVVTKERASIEEMLNKEVREHDRSGGKDMPSLGYVLTPRGRKAMPHKGKNHHYKPATAKEDSPEELQAQFDRVAVEKKEKELELTKTFNESSDNGSTESGDSGSSGAQVAPKKQKNRYRKSRKERNQEQEQDEVRSRRRTR